MTAVALADRVAIEECIRRYAWASDQRDVAALAACFTSDAVHRLHVEGGSPEFVRGAQAIAAWVEGRHRDAFARGVRRRHLTCCTLVEARAHGRAAARSYFQVVEAAPGSSPSVASFGHYEDQLLHEAGRWLLCEREVHVEGRRLA